MKEIKRYSKPHKVWIPSKLGGWCQSKDVSELEAVVETKDKTITMYEESSKEANRFAELLMSEKKELQNKIEELEKIIFDSWNQQCPCAKGIE